ncbi:MAG: hypothetical protein ABIO39_07030 [Caulobacteraceae bacterium]
MKTPAILAALAVAGAMSVQAQPTVPADAVHVEGRTDTGARWVMDMPKAWNGVVLLWSRGYAGGAQPPEPEDAPRDMRPWLLANGYALAGSSYSTAGWAVEQAVPDQLATLAAFKARFGEPKRAIAWGDSMGGMVSIALAERAGEQFAGALPMCGSVAGAVGMMNVGLDGAFAFKTLVAPGADIDVVNVRDDFRNAQTVRAELAAARATPQGRARVALAAALAQLPPWTDPKVSEPAADDVAAQEAETAKAFASGTFLPRTDQEKRAGGAFSWNVGVDYRAQLKLSGRRAQVASLYRTAGLDLDKDLAALNAAPRITAQPAAVAYMKANYTPTGDVRIPVLSMHTLGDGVTSVNGEMGYIAAVNAAGRGANMRALFVRGAGHCTFTPAERIAALTTLTDRLDKGRWSVAPVELQRRAAALNLGEARFTAATPAPFLRPCTTRQKRCVGEPVRSALPASAGRVSAR